MTNPDHDYDDPASETSRLQALQLLDGAVAPYCALCIETRRVVPTAGVGWMVEHSHEESCPQHDDRAQVEDVLIGPDFDLEEYREAQHIWAASTDDHPADEV